MRTTLGTLRRLLHEAANDRLQQLADAAGVEPIDVQVALQQHANQADGTFDWVFDDPAAEAAIVRSAQQAQADRVQRSRHSGAAHRVTPEKT